jgi:hypothetical protein
MITSANTCGAPGSAIGSLYRFNLFGRIVVFSLLVTATPVWSQDGDWTFEVGTMFLKKEDPSSTTLFVDPGTSAPLFNASEFQFNHEFGSTIKIGRYLDSASGVEMKFFGIDGWSSSDVFVAPAGADLNTIPPVGVGGGAAQTVEVLYSSQLVSTEFNYHELITERWRWLAGLRYVELIESLDARRTPTLADIHVNADNYLYGFQVGTEGSLWDAGGMLRLEGFFKTGIYDNYAKNGLGYVQAAGPDWTNADQTSHASFLGEAGVTGVVQLTPSLELRLGYQGLWLTSVAEATRQPPDMTIVPLPGIGGGIDVSGSPFFHGGNILLTMQR